MLPRLLENGSDLEVGEDFFLAFSPERVDPGRTDYTTRNTPKVIGGVTPACLEVASAYYRAGDRDAGAGLVARGGRDGQAV